MAAVELSGVVKRAGGATILDNINLQIADGELAVVVGPSGCGKSTLLRVVAGLEDVQHGQVRIDGDIVNDASPSERGAAMVFQSYALYPHMSVYQNMAFAMSLAKRPKLEIDAAVRRAAQILAIEDLLERKPASLSGGQRQRVAIGRAIVRRPKVFLFDEPLSNLDAALRSRMRVEFAQLHERLNATMLYVTHDQHEALSIAEKIIVLSKGRIEQIGAPMELYERPANMFVAAFIGSPRMNFLAGALGAGADHDKALVTLPSGAVLAASADCGALGANTEVTLGIRPEHIELVGEGGNLRGRVKFLEQLGALSYVYCETVGASEPIVIQLPARAPARPGDLVDLFVAPQAVHVFGPDGISLPRTAPHSALVQH